MTELSGPFDVLLNIFPVDGRLDVVQGLHVVVGADLWCFKLGRWNLHQRQCLTCRVTREGGNIPAAVGCGWVGNLLELGGGLATTDGEHESLVDDVSNIRARVAFTGFTQLSEVFRGQGRLGLSRVDLEDGSTCVCLGK